VESAAMGLLAGINAARLALRQSLVTPPRTTAMGGLVCYITQEPLKEFQPMNVNFGIIPPLEKVRKGGDKRQALADRSLKDMEDWIHSLHPLDNP